MEDEVKFIFKTLIKVPVIIFVSFFILNIFAFFFIYFKMLGLSYVVMQETVDKNFIASRQKNQMLDVLQDIDDIAMAKNTGIVIGKDASGKDAYITCSNRNIPNKPLGNSYKSALERTQYGAVKYVGVRTEYKFIWPLTQVETLEDGKVSGYNNNYGATGGGTLSASELEDAREDKQGNLEISITYEVPGLKYYADLSN